MVIDIECHLSNKLPGITIIGYTSKAVDEAKKRLRSAFSSSKINLPPQTDRDQPSVRQYP